MSVCAHRASDVELPDARREERSAAPGNQNITEGEGMKSIGKLTIKVYVNGSLIKEETIRKIYVKIGKSKHPWGI